MKLNIFYKLLMSMFVCLSFAEDAGVGEPAPAPAGGAEPLVQPGGGREAGILGGGEPAPAAQPGAETPAGEPVTTPQAGETSQWYAGLPEAMHEKFKDVSPEDAAAALERGLDYIPVESVESIQLELPKDFPLAPEHIDSFKQFSVENKLSASSVQALMQHYAAEEVKAFNTSVVENKAKLAEIWGDPSGPEYVEKMASANRAISYLDSMVMGGRLGESLANEYNGLSHNAAFAEVMAEFGKGIKEADVPASSGSEPADVEMGTKEFFEQFHPTN